MDFLKPKWTNLVQIGHANTEIIFELLQTSFPWRKLVLREVSA